jgi:predicted CoA-binding protein
MNSFSDILNKYKKITVVGISANPDRPSHWITQYLVAAGYDVVGVNPGNPNIEFVKVVRSLSEVEDPLEIVNVFRSPEAIPALVEELAARKPAVLWLQPGAQNPEAEDKARKLGMVVVSGPCIYQEHKSLK